MVAIENLKTEQGSFFNKAFFYFPFSLVVVTLYRNSILPGKGALIGNEIFVIFILSIIYLVWLVDGENLLKLKISIFSGTSKYIFFLFVLFCISTFVFNSQEVTKLSNLVRFLDLTFIVIIFFWIIPYIIMTDPVNFKRLVLIISYFSFVASVIGFLMFALKIDAGYNGLMVSFIGHPNYVPVIFNAGLISTLFYIDWQRDNLTQYKLYFYYFSLALQLMASLLTYTRAGYIGLGAAILVYFLLKYRKKFLIFIPPFLFVTVFVIPPFFKAKGYSSFVSRLYLLLPAYQMMTNDTQSLLWGYGVTNTFKVFLQYNMFNLAKEDYINNPHNAVASLILMFGLIYAVAIIFFIFLFLIRFSYKSLKTKSDSLKIFYGYLVSFLVSYLFLSLFDSSVLMPEFFNIHVFLIFLGLMNYLTKNQDSTSKFLMYLQKQ